MVNGAPSAVWWQWWALRTGGVTSGWSVWQGERCRGSLSAALDQIGGKYKKAQSHTKNKRRNARVARHRS